MSLFCTFFFFISEWKIRCRTSANKFSYLVYSLYVEELIKKKVLLSIIKFDKGEYYLFPDSDTEIAKKYLFLTLKYRAFS